MLFPDEEEISLKVPLINDDKRPVVRSVAINATTARTRMRTGGERNRLNGGPLDGDVGGLVMLMAVECDGSEVVGKYVVTEFVSVEIKLLLVLSLLLLTCSLCSEAGR